MSLDRYFLLAVIALAVPLIVWGLISEWREYRELSRKVRQALPSEHADGAEVSSSPGVGLGAP